MLSGRAKEQFKRHYASDLVDQVPSDRALVGQLDLSGDNLSKIKDTRLRLRLSRGRNDFHLERFRDWLGTCKGRVICHLDRDDPIGTVIEMRSDSRSNPSKPPFYVDFNDITDPVDEGHVRKSEYDLEIDMHNNRVGRAICEE